MINEIKQIIRNYLNNAKLCSFMVGTVTTAGIKVSDKLIIPHELIVGNLKSIMIPGQKVRLLRNHGGQQFFLLEVVSDDT